MSPEVVPATLRNTRRVTLALWWKLSLFFAIAALLGNLAIGFLGYALPFGQAQFALASGARALFGSAAAEFLAAVPGAIEIALGLVNDAIVLALLFVILNRLLTTHIGRDFAGFRLVLERVR